MKKTKTRKKMANIVVKEDPTYVSVLTKKDKTDIQWLEKTFDIKTETSEAI